LQEQSRAGRTTGVLRQRTPVGEDDSII
jgi:hypothetical protein